MIVRRIRVLAVASLLLGAAVIAAVLDARTRTLDAEAIDRVVLRTRSSELALSTTSRWLRHPAEAEPGAACQDQPPCLDVDPGGLAIAPPRARFDRSVSVELRVEGSP
ncbi:MAG: hypothetical protein K1X94_21680 [Sandaracinaceae bacterium]|nr:hypothetical protein [Sandaracinaceae bacterium]